MYSDDHQPLPPTTDPAEWLDGYYAYIHSAVDRINDEFASAAALDKDEE